MINADVTMCCSGYMCGCMGLPVHPPLCEECDMRRYDNEKHANEYAEEAKEEGFKNVLIVKREGER